MAIAHECEHKHKCEMKPNCIPNCLYSTYLSISQVSIGVDYEESGFSFQLTCEALFNLGPENLFRGFNENLQVRARKFCPANVFSPTSFPYATWFAIRRWFTRTSIERRITGWNTTNLLVDFWGRVCTKRLWVDGTVSSLRQNSPDLFWLNWSDYV